MKLTNLNNKIKQLEQEQVGKDTSTGAFIAIARQFESVLEESTPGEKETITSLMIDATIDLVDDQINTL